MSAPKQVRRTFAPEPDAPRAARRFVEDALKAWGLIDPEGTAALVTSELTTNAVRHARTPVELGVAKVNHRRIRVEVVDDDPTLPEPKAVDGTSTGGHGLPIVEKLAEQWGTELIDGNGKQVWALLALHAGN
jgi:anti-sigma regulatory factor (Ser/Thr protein kinase)